MSPTNDRMAASERLDFTHSSSDRSRNHSDYVDRFVGPDMFRQLLVSRRDLERADDESRCLRGLCDDFTHERFLISEAELMRPGRLG